MKKIDRLQFLQIAGGIFGAGVATAAAACGGDDPAPGATCNPSAPMANISQNHGHSMIVTAAEVWPEYRRCTASKARHRTITWSASPTSTFTTCRAAGALPRIRRPGELTATSTRSRSAELLRRLQSPADEVAELLRIERLLNHTTGRLFERLRRRRGEGATGEKHEATSELGM